MTVLKLKESPEKDENNIEIEKVHRFFVEHLALPEHLLKDKTTGELLKIYEEVLSVEPTEEKFNELIEKNNSSEKPIEIPEKEKVSLFKRFLILKLPKELIERQLVVLSLNDEEEIPLEVLEKIHQAREGTQNRMILGLHIANLDYDGEIPTSKYSSTTLVNGEKIEIPAGYSHYSTKKLYGNVFKRGNNVFLYLIEGSSGDKTEGTKKYSEAHQEGGWIATARNLPIIYKVKLTPEVENELGLEHE